MYALSRPEYHSEEAAFAHLERIVWNDGPVCVHCGGVDRITKVKANPAKRIREGLWRCGHCKGQFTAKIGTVFEHARIPLHKMLQAVYLMTASKKGISAHQLHRVLEITYKSAWFLAHRIREAMASGDLSAFGTGGGIVEADETFIGRLPGTPKRRAYHHKMKVLALLDRDTGKARTMVVDDVTAKTVMPIVKANVAKEAILMTDESRIYLFANRHFAAHGTTNHSAGEYVDPEIPAINTNAIEGYFSIFKRGMKGVYQHCDEQHLQRYLTEFDFRYNHRAALNVSDDERAVAAHKGAEGKRLTYRRTPSA
jgi:transposase-like protein